MLKKNKQIKVIYIAGNGHSGSTLLDIVIGSSPGIFSAGELCNIARDSIFEEYCSCGDKIADCSLWRQIVKKWIEKSSMSMEEYKRLRWKYERNKTTLITLKNTVFPSHDFLSYCKATLALFETIQEVTGKNVIVDSSKAPQRIPVLNKIVNLKVVHICRNAKGVLNSAKRTSKKNIKAGIENDFPARSTRKTLIEWMFVNFFMEVFSIGIPSKKLKYRRYVKNLQLVNKVDAAVNIQSGSYHAPHMLAGNIIRLKNNIHIDKMMGFKYKRLTKKQLFLADFLDRIFFFWN